MSARVPSLPRLPRLPGAADRPSLSPKPPKLGRAARFTQKDFLPYPDKPSWFVNSIEEWICYYWLTEIKGYHRIGAGYPIMPGSTFFYQVTLPALGVFTKSSGTRVDFVIPQEAGSPYRNICWDPITPFTHPDASLDRLKRIALATQDKSLLIWIDGASLAAGDFSVLDKALQGIDVSSRAKRGS